ncbi:MAG: hypothetical protein ACYS8W_02275 [Planctomycetota bacterium]|jgi:hypothetical protein
MSAEEKNKPSDFSKRFNSKYKEKLSKDKRDSAKKVEFFQRYLNELGQLYNLIEEVIAGTAIESGRESFIVTRKISSFDVVETELEKLRLTLGNYFILVTPEGVDYDTGRASVDIEHNNIREKPLHIALHLQFVNRTEENPSGVLSWMLKIGYKNYSQFNRDLIEKLIEGVFLS